MIRSKVCGGYLWDYLLAFELKTVNGPLLSLRTMSKKVFYNARLEGVKWCLPRSHDALRTRADQRFEGEWRGGRESSGLRIACGSASV